jgi:uncharacterized protein YwgA
MEGGAEMNDIIDYVTSLVRLNGGELVGKTRLQKIAYLLECLDLGCGLKFDYHNFGPFSAELAFAADDAASLWYLEVEERPGFHSVPYTVFKVRPEMPIIDDEKDGMRRSALAKMETYSALVLELAATAVYLKRNGFEQNCWNELRQRKPSKANPELISKAKDLVQRLGL